MALRVDDIATCFFSDRAAKMLSMVEVNPLPTLRLAHTGRKE